MSENDRLTERDHYGDISLKGRDYFVDDVCATYTNDHSQALREALGKLARYEDSGLTPEEVEELVTGEKTNTAQTLRPCVWNGRSARFHRWCDWSEIVEPSAMVGGHNGGELRYTVGIIELEDGTIRQVLPKDIRFTDSARMDAKGRQ